MMKKRQSFELFGHTVLPGKTARFSIAFAKLLSNTPLQIPVVVSHARKEGPVLLLLAGIHGDEVNGTEIIRRIIRKGWHKPTHGTIICIPVYNILGFLNSTREFPDGRDLNRVFPGSKNGSLASQFAYIFMKEIAPLIDIIIDLHCGAAQRNNYPQIRCDFKNTAVKELCDIFAAPLTVHSSVIPKSIRSSITKMGKKYILFEGGKSNRFDEIAIDKAIIGIQRVMTHIGVRHFELDPPKGQRFEITKSKWVRASNSGVLNLMIENGTFIEKGTVLAKIADPFGKFERSVKAPFDGIIFNVNEMPLVTKGDALFNIGYYEN